MCHLAVPPMIGTAFQMISSAMEARDAGDDNREEAQQLRERGAREAALVRRDSDRSRAQRRVALLRGGVTDSGSPTDVLADAAQEGERSAYWAQRGYSEAARAKEREARRSRRRGILDQLTNASSIGGNVIELTKS